MTKFTTTDSVVPFEHELPPEPPLADWERFGEPSMPNATSSTSSTSSAGSVPSPNADGSDGSDGSRNPNLEVGGQTRIAQRFAAEWGGQLLFVHGLGWHYWDGTRWAIDEDGQAHRCLIQTLQRALADSLREPHLRGDVAKAESANAQKGVLQIASNLEAFTCTVVQLDADPFLLNVANGTLDLRTMELRAHDHHDRITKVTRGAYRPDSEGPQWDTFLQTVLPDSDVREYFQRFIGLSLLGKVREHIFAIATGEGKNGKGVSYNAILNALGDYGHAAESDLFMVGRSNPNGATPALMGLRGKRLVVVSETERDHRLATALMKGLTGGDPITARALHRNPVTFEPSHTSLMVTNFLPKVAGDDPAAWRRIRVIPFDYVVPKSDRNPMLGEVLALEADAILTWAIDGYRQYAAEGMNTPLAVRAATDRYAHESDAVARFLADCTEKGSFVPVGELFERWTRWALDDGTEPLGKRAFGQAMERHGYPSKVHGGMSVRMGIALKNGVEK